MALRNISNNLNYVNFKYAPIVKSVDDNRCMGKMMPPTLVTPPCTSSSSSSSASSTSSVQIRTSSPISSSDSSEASSSAAIISPSKFINAVHTSRKKAQQQLELKHYQSLKELAFEKLRKQQIYETNLKQHFNVQADQLDLAAGKLKSNGKLKISAYANLSHLTVHVIEGAAYRGETGPTYVKLNQLPDAKSSSLLKSKLVKLTDVSTSRPKYVYNEKMSFETCHLNPANRLVFSVWNARDEMIGCFSLRLKAVLNPTESSGKVRACWYHLLPVEYGLVKNVKCSSTRRTAGEKLPPNENKDLIGMDKLNLVVVKSELQNYGFTVLNSCPCQIGKVEMDSVAYRAGLRAGDFISKINDINVSRASCESVVKMIKSSKIKLLIEVCREKTFQRANSLTSVNRYTVVSKPAPQLDVVPEEDEDELDESNDQYDDDLIADHEQQQNEPDFYKIYNSLRYVDSISSCECNEGATDNDYDQLDNGAEALRRVAVQYYSRKANVRVLNPYQVSAPFTVSNFNQKF